MVIQKLDQVKQKGIKIILVTGRAAGWGQALANYFDFVDYLIAENGLVFIDDRGGLKSIYSAGTEFENKLSSNGERIREEFNLSSAKESSFSLFEKTFVRPPNFTAEHLERCNRLVDRGLEVVASSIHIHLRPDELNKGDALQHVLEQTYPELTAHQVIVIGDSPSDGPLFKKFPLSVGVANVTEYIDELKGNLPLYITAGREGFGAVEIMDKILGSPGGRI